MYGDSVHTISTTRNNLINSIIHGTTNNSYILAVNDGVYKVVSCGNNGMNGITVQGCLTDEKFTGYICSLSVPKPFVELCRDIQTYNTENKAGVMISESFGGYSYTKATVNGQLATWKDAFAGSLKPYRRMTDGLEWVKEVK